MEEELITAKGEGKSPLKGHEKSHLRNFNLILTVFGIAFSFLSLMYYLLPIFAGFIGLVLGLVIGVYLILSSVATLGIIYVNQDYRSFVGNRLFAVPSFFFNVGTHVENLSPYFPIFGFGGIFVCLFSLIVACIGKGIGKRGFVKYIVLNAVFMVLAAIATVLYYANGGHVLK